MVANADDPSIAGDSDVVLLSSDCQLDKSFLSAIGDHPRVVAMGENGMSFNKGGLFIQENHQKLDQIFQQLLSELNGIS